MKKIIAILTVLSLLLVVLVGCGSDESPTTATTQATEPTTEATTEATEPTTETTEPTTETTEPTTEATEPTTEATEPTTEATEPVDEDPTGLSGTVEGNVYTNTKAGFGISLADSWHVYSKAEIAALMGLTADMFADEKIKELVEAGSSTTVYYASDISGNNINIAWENVGLAGALLTADTYIDLVMVSLEDSLASAGFANLSCEKTTASFLGNDCPAISISAEFSGIAIHELLVPTVCGTYVCLTTICTVNTDTCADVLSNFYPLQ